MSERFDNGMKIRRSVLGDAHVDRAEAAKTAFDEPFQSFITEGAWGSASGTKSPCMSAPRRIPGPLLTIFGKP